LWVLVQCIILSFLHSYPRPRSLSLRPTPNSPVLQPHIVSIRFLQISILFYHETRGWNWPFTSPPSPAIGRCDDLWATSQKPPPSLEERNADFPALRIARFPPNEEPAPFVLRPRARLHDIVEKTLLFLWRQNTCGCQHVISHSGNGK
jgi:hypothetical protein